MYFFFLTRRCYDAEAIGSRSASSPNSLIVRTTRSTLSRNPFRVSRAKRTVNIENVATRTSPSTASSLFTAWGWSSWSTSRTCFAIVACLVVANGIRSDIVCQSVTALVLSDIVIEQDLVRSIFGFHREVLKGSSAIFNLLQYHKCQLRKLEASCMPIHHSETPSNSGRHFTCTTLIHLTKIAAILGALSSGLGRSGI